MAFIIILLIILIGGTLIYASYLWGYGDGRISIQRDIFIGLRYNGFYTLPVTEGNETQLIRLVPYMDGVQG